MMNELRDRVSGSTIFTQFDLKSGYNLIQIKEGDELMTAFARARVILNIWSCH